MNNLDPNKKVNDDLIEHIGVRLKFIYKNFNPKTDDEIEIHRLLNLLIFLIQGKGFLMNFYILNLFISIYYFLLKIDGLGDLKKEIEFCIELIEQNQRGI